MSLARDLSVFLQNALDGMKAVRATDSWTAQLLFHARQPVFGGLVNSGDDFFGYQVHEIGSCCCGACHNRAPFGK